MGTPRYLGRSTPALNIDAFTGQLDPQKLAQLQGEFEEDFNDSQGLEDFEGDSEIDDDLGEFLEDEDMEEVCTELEKALAQGKKTERRTRLDEELKPVDPIALRQAVDPSDGLDVDPKTLLPSHLQRATGGVYHLSFQGYDVRFFVPWVEKVGLMAQMVRGMYASGPVVLPTRTHRVTPATSPHKFKTAMEHWVLDRHRRMIRIEGDIPTLERFVFLVKEMQQPAVAMRIIRRVYYPIEDYFSVTQPRQQPSSPSSSSSSSTRNLI